MYYVRNDVEMKINLLYFATFRDLIGFKKEEILMPEETTIADLQIHLAKLHPSIERGLPSAVFTINRDFAFADAIIKDGDEVAIFPPISGG
jgi:molybdopterin converting factor subunit 1